MKQVKRKCKDGATTVRIPIRLHTFIVKLGAKEGLNNYEVIEKMAQHYAVSFCPNLAVWLNNSNRG